MGRIAKGGGREEPVRIVPDSSLTNSAVFVIVPVFNEARVLRQTLASLVSTGYRIVVVDDGSTDSTSGVLEQIPVTVIRHAVNLGQGAALQTGMDFALRHGALIAVHFDADGQHCWQQIPDLTAPIERDEADVVLGSRFLRPGSAAQMPALRRLVLRGGVVVSAVFTGLWLSDTHNGFRALSRKALGEIQLHENGFAHATEILGQIRRRKLRYAEVPTAVFYSEYSRKKGQSLWNSLNIVIDLVLEKLFQ